MTTPNKPLLRKWVAALRSGKYHQAREQLCVIEDNQSYHCCLGVLCRVAKKHGWPIKSDKTFMNKSAKDFTYKDDTNGVRLPTTLLVEVGLNYGIQNELIRMNDVQHRSFKEIADRIEEIFDL